MTIMLTVLLEYIIILSIVIPIIKEDLKRETTKNLIGVAIFIGFTYVVISGIFWLVSNPTAF